MGMGKGIGLAVVGGAIGAVIWAMISHLTNFEIGWIASITGALAGLGFRMGYPRGGATAGAIAAIIGVSAIAGGKIAAIVLDVQGYSYSYDAIEDREVLIAYLADEIVEERRLAGEAVRWPREKRPAMREGRTDFDREIWHEAEARWDAMAPRQKGRFAAQPTAAYLDELLISYIADDVSEEWASAGRAVAWPEGAHPTNEYRRSWYDPEVWAEAEDRWDVIPAEAKDEWRADETTTTMSFGASLEFAFQALPQTLHPFDALWVILGLAAAFKIASEGDDAQHPDAYVM